MIFYRMSYKAPTKHQNQQPEGGHVAEDEYVVVLGGSHGRAYSVETNNNDSGLEVSITPFDHPNAVRKGEEECLYMCIVKRGMYLS